VRVTSTRRRAFRFCQRGKDRNEELAQSAYSLYVTQNPQEQARLVKMLLSNCTFDRGSSLSYLQ
jgi:hypothetical protein